MDFLSNSPNRHVMDMSNKVTYSASAFSALWGLFTVEQWIGIAGLAVAVVGLSIRTWMDSREEKRRIQRHELETEIKQAQLDQLKDK